MSKNLDPLQNLQSLNLLYKTDPTPQNAGKRAEAILALGEDRPPPFCPKRQLGELREMALASEEHRAAVLTAVEKAGKGDLLERLRAHCAGTALVS